jgi:L-aminopeptidase/D-esterase-like protein
MKLQNSITDVPGILVGQEQDIDALTGCTVILCKDGAVGGIDQRGGAPGTRETDLLRPVHLVEKVNAVLLAGGSAFGLDAATGVVKFLEEQGAGFNSGVVRVPIVPAAVLFDLDIGRPDVRPNAEMAYKACLNASRQAPLQGNFGAGCGATVGKMLGIGQAVKSGIGTASMEIGSGIIVGAIVAMNAFGDVIDPDNGRIIAGARTISKGPVKIGSEEIFADTLKIMRSIIGRAAFGFISHHNTVIGTIATNAGLNKEEINKVAQMAHDGLARTVKPAHTMFDGDTIFALSTGNKKADVNIVGTFAAEVFSAAVLNAIKYAKSAGGIPSMNEL